MATGYELGEVFLRATTHEAPEIRRRADRRAQRWAQTIEAIADGRVEIGFGTPVRTLPPWVTREALAGELVPGTAVAEVPLQAGEIALADRLGIPAARRHIFGYFLTDAGLEELYGLLDSAAYRVEIPEDAALLTIAWLVRAGDREAALDILDALSPFAEKFRFAPKTADTPASPPGFVYQITAGEAAEVLRSRRSSPQIEAQREALAVWNPFSDRVLAHWLEKYQEGRIVLDRDSVWRSEAAALVEEYDRLAVTHTNCSKHRKPKENLAILLGVLRAASMGEELGARERGLVRHAIEASVEKRGIPGSEKHATLRDRQRIVVTAPTHPQLATIAAERLRPLDQTAGIEHPGTFLGNVTSQEAAEAGVAEGAVMPPIVSRLVERAHSAPVEKLLEEGVVPSAAALARLVPQMRATAAASGFGDRALATLVAANYRALGQRRSWQPSYPYQYVELSDLPWARATARHSEVTSDEASAVLQRVGALALDHFPATIMPNALVRELQHLSWTAGHEVPLVEEISPDTFLGMMPRRSFVKSFFRTRFSDRFRTAAQVAAHVVGGTLYTRYYGIDTDQILKLAEPPDRSGWRRFWQTSSEPTFADVCWARAGEKPAHWSRAANGVVIEQSQILTTHNLAALFTIGIRPTRAWADLAREAIQRSAALVSRAAHRRCPSATLKEAADAWRQAVFYLSVAGPAEAESVLSDESIAGSGPVVMAELLGDLRRAAAGQELGDEHAPFLGWTIGRHWVLDV